MEKLRAYGRSMEKMSDDVVLLILVRVTGIRDLFRSAVTCKRWRRLIADPSFLLRRWPEGVRHPSSLIGFFTEQRLQERSKTRRVPMPLMPPSFVPAPLSPLGRRRPYSDVPPRNQFFQVPPLGSRHGFLLVRLVPCDDLMIQALHGMTSFALYDPLAGTGRVLPPLDTDGPLKITGCAILTDADRCSNDQPCPASSTYTAFFKLMIIGTFQDGDRPGHKLCIFTSSESRWSKLEKFYDPWEHGARAEPTHVNATVCQGMAHWLFRTVSYHYALKVSVETAHVSFRKLPATLSSNRYRFSGSSLLGVNNDGKLLLISIDYKFRSLAIWTRQGDNGSKDGTAEWVRTRVIKLESSNQSWNVSALCICMGGMSGALLLKDNQSCVHILDLQTGAMETVQSWFCGVVVKAFPYEMDWPAFFMSRLGGGNIERTEFGGAILNSFWKGLFAQLFLG